MRRILLLLAACCFSAAAWGQKPPLLPEKDVAALANELSGETAKRNLEGIARFHRQRGSQGFHAAAELVAERLRAYGLSDVAILQFPADGKIFYGTQRSRPAWDAEVGELSEINPERTPPCDKKSIKSGKVNCILTAGAKIASYEAEPVVLAEESENVNVMAVLVDVGEVGIVSYALNQKTAWWGEDENLIRWGHLETFSANKTLRSWCH
jgi:aminopeptidase YwaD